MGIMERRYFILDRISYYELQALESCIGELWTQRYSLNGSQVVIKTNQKIINSFFAGSVENLGKEYTDLNELRIILNSELWQINDFI